MDKLNELLQEKYKIQDSIKSYKGYKVKSPEETIKIIENSFDKINLKVKYIPRENQLLNPYSSFQSGTAYLYSKENEDLGLLKSGGKGVTPLLARASATAELIERFTGYGLAKGQIGHYLSFFKYNRLWLSKRERSKNLSNLFPFHYIEADKILPDNFEETFSNLSKSVCYSLTQKKFFSYPEEFITIIEGSNGLASGNTFEEATLHAINEVIERLIGFYILSTLPKFNEIKKDSITHPTLRKLIESVESTGLEFKMLDFSHLFEIPVIVTIFDHPEWDLPTNIYTDMNCEFPKMIIGVDTDPQDAAMRCFTEIIQSVEPIYYAKSNYYLVKNKFKIADLDTSEKWKLYLRTTNSTFQNGNQPMNVDLRKYLKSSQKGFVSIQDIISIYDVNHKIEIDRVVNNLKKNNVEILIHDITYPILKFPVVRAMLSGGKGEFENIPFTGYKRLIIDAKNEEEKYSFLKQVISTTFTKQAFYDIIGDGTWCSSDDQKKLIDSVKSHISFSGPNPPLWGKQICKFYFLGLLYLKMKNYDQAKKCFNAALYRNFNDIAPLIGLLYVHFKKGEEKEYKEVRDHINMINDTNINVEEALKDMDNPVINPNPFELCDLDCKNKNKPDFCKQCFFNYVSEDIFMKDFIEEYISP